MHPNTSGRAGGRGGVGGGRGAICAFEVGYLLYATQTAPRTP